jgi:molecular chaperone GrpE
MTSGRRPAGAPEGWEERPPAGAAEQGREPGHPSPAPVPEDTSDQGSEVAEDLDALLADVQRERDEYLQLAQRAKADFENYRKRAARDVAEAERRGKAALARELVPSIDNLERALAAGERDSEVARGVELVHGELQATLGRAGVESYDPTGERFDPTLHEAVSTMPGGDGVEAGTVVETLERGYRLDGQVLRPARVVVSE